MLRVASEECIKGKLTHYLSSQTSSLEFGLLIGSNVNDKNNHSIFIFNNIPTPPEPEKLESSTKITTLSQLNVSWVYEHINQVSKMLPGGIVVIGLYLCCSSQDKSQNTSKIYKLLELVKAKGCVHPILLRACTTTRQITCEGYNSSQGLAKVELKWRSTINDFSCFSLCLNAEALQSLTLQPTTPNTNDLSTQIKSSFSTLITDLFNSSIFVINDQIVEDGKPIREALKKGNKPAKGKENTVNLFKVGITHDLEDTTSSKSNQNTNLRLKGGVYGYCYVHNNSDVTKIKDSLRQDLIQSLSFRMELLNQDSEQEMEQSDAITKQQQDRTGDTGQKHSVFKLGDSYNKNKVQNWVLPKRVLVHFNKAEEMKLSDYLLECENEDQCIERCVAMLGAEVAKQCTAVEDFEMTGKESVKKGVAVSKNDHAQEILEQRQEKKGNGMIVAVVSATLFILLAIILGMLRG